MARKEHKWTKYQLSLLGTMSDSKVAEKIGVSRLTVYRKRTNYKRNDTPRTVYLPKETGQWIDDNIDNKSRYMSDAIVQKVEMDKGKK